MSTSFVFLSHGKLFIRTPEGSVREIESQFARTMQERVQEINRRNEWKTAGRGAQFARGGAWAQQLSMPAPEITSVTLGPAPGQLLYTLTTDEVGGVFAITADGREERRLRHSNTVFMHHASMTEDRLRLACSVDNEDGSSNISVMDVETGRLREITDGDSVDIAPQWIPGHPDEILYQSAGVARDRDGMIAGLGSFTACRISLETGEIVTEYQEKGMDVLLPRLSADGTPHYIRRPYRRLGSTTFKEQVLDIVLFPWRLLVAVFGFLNAFSFLFSGKPLRRAGAGRSPNHELRKMRIWGHLVDAKAVVEKNRRGQEDAPDLVPRDWELCRRDSDGSSAVLAKAVLFYDLASDGSVLHSNGSAIFRTCSDGRREMLHKHEGIEQLMVLEEAGDPAVRA